LSDNKAIMDPGLDSAISINGVISQSYTYFMHNFDKFLKLALGPILIWVALEIGSNYFYLEQGKIYDTTVPRAIICAGFALLWYRQFLMGSEHATYSQLVDHILAPGVFNLYNLLWSIIRIVITTIVLFVPTLILSISFMVYQYSQGQYLNEVAIQDIAFKSTTLVILLFSPILVRLSLYTVGIALGRRKMSLRNVWKKTSGNTITLWLLILRAFLPISLYSYFVTWAFAKFATQFDLNYFWEGIAVNLPTAFFTFMMLAIVVAANGEAFKVIFGIRSAKREET